MKKILNPKSFQSAFTEIASIVIGVLIALAVNEWNEDRVHTQRANEAMQNIVQELKKNIKFLKVVHDNNNKVINLLQNKDSNQQDIDTIQFVPGLQIQDTAWQTLLSTGVSEYVDYKQLYQISSVYSMQDIYKSLGYQMVQTMMSTNALAEIISNKVKPIKNDLYLDNMILIVDIEKALLKSYQDTMDIFNPLK
jgi:hypothetical protein